MGFSSAECPHPKAGHAPLALLGVKVSNTFPSREEGVRMLKRLKLFYEEAESLFVL
jgi:hypothetical protein